MKQLVNLIEINLGQNSITDISVLKYLTNIQSLVLCDNQVIDIQCLKNLKHLTELHLTNNQVVYVNCLANIGFKELFINANRIQNTDFQYLSTWSNAVVFEFGQQFEPSREHLLLANKLKYIHESCDQQCNFQLIRNKIRKTLNQLKQTAQLQIDLLIQSQTQFTNIIASLFCSQQNEQQMQ
ncbi:leucine-rich_repeat domain-containing protein [Hexamita inflata]|uniref:Leucine-rich repeat domain-containing protein n=1 Tax=Hexamita inflata TaxID=28002 RepID=A0AA86U130_9EUKA|nr:leucine-rich repeat domain-containing protein [Hexamita inflata]